MALLVREGRTEGLELVDARHAAVALFAIAVEHHDAFRAVVKGVLELFRERNLAARNERVLALEVDAVLVVLRAAETHVLIRVRLAVGLAHALEVADIGALAVRLEISKRNTQRRVIHRGDRERGIVRRGAARRTVIEATKHVVRPTLE